MDETPKVFAPELSPAGSKRWIARLVVAIVLGAGIWSFVVSLTTNVVVPALARLMEADPQSPLYLGKGDFNIAGLFVSLLELCFAVIAAVVVGAFSQSKVKPSRRATRPAPARVTSISAPPVSPLPQTGTQVPAPTPPSPAAVRPPAPPQPAPQPPQAAPAPAPAAKPQPPAPPKPKKVYYNSVGDPIEYDDE